MPSASRVTPSDSRSSLSPPISTGNSCEMCDRYARIILLSGFFRGFRADTRKVRFESKGLMPAKERETEKPSAIVTATMRSLLRRPCTTITYTHSFHSQISTLNPEPSILNSQLPTLYLSTLNSQLSTLHPQPSALNDTCTEARKSPQATAPRFKGWGFRVQDTGYRVWG